MRSPDRPSLVAETLPVAAAIGVFGVIYGATAAEVLGAVATIASSVTMFSGAAQFAMVAMIDSGATPLAVVLAVSVLALRHVPLAAVVRGRLPDRRARRAALGLVLTDETVGLAVAARRPAARTMAVVGVTAYLAWIVGTTAGVMGADLVAAASLAGAVFVVLFIGLAASTCRRSDDVVRAVVAAAVTGVLLVTVPALGTLGAIVAAAACAATARGRPS